MNDIEFFSLSKGLKLTEGFELLTPEQQGMVVEGAWLERMKALVDDQLEVPKQGSEYDALRVSTGRRADVKFVRKVNITSYEQSASVYMSHNEYLAGREHNTVFTVFYNRGGAGALLKVFTFAEAKEAGAIQLYENGKYVQCARMGGVLKAPWSIELFLLDPALRKILIPAQG
jgi:hypothetical protein